MKALEICARNSQTAKAVSEDRKAAMRAQFPSAAQIADELVAAGFKPRVVWMTEGNKTWGTGANHSHQPRDKGRFIHASRP